MCVCASTQPFVEEFCFVSLKGVPGYPDSHDLDGWQLCKWMIKANMTDARCVGVTQQKLVRPVRIKSIVMFVVGKKSRISIVINIPSFFHHQSHYDYFNNILSQNSSTYSYVKTLRPFQIRLPVKPNPETKRTPDEATQWSPEATPSPPSRFSASQLHTQISQRLLLIGENNHVTRLLISGQWLTAPPSC